MLATIINAALILLGGGLGLLLAGKISTRFTDIVSQGLALCVMGIGLSSALGGEDTLCTIVCMAAGCLLGEALQIEERLDRCGDFLKTRLLKNKGESRFTEGFVTASVLFCVGAMAVMGSIDAGVRGDYRVLISKSVIDGITAITFAAVMGVGVLFSAAPVVLYQGGITLLAAAIAPYLDPAALLAMSAVGGLIILGIGLNMLGVSQKKIKVGNMLPGIFLPFAYLPIRGYLMDIVARVF